MLDKLFVNRIHLRKIYIHFWSRIINQSNTPPLKPIYSLYICIRKVDVCAVRKRRLKPHKKDKVNFQSLLDFASCPHNNSVPFVLIRTFNSYARSSIKLPITNGFYVSTPTEKEISNAIAKPLYLRKNNNTTQAQMKHIKFMSVKSKKWAS